MNMGNFGANMEMVLKLKSAWEQFTSNHPKFPAYLNAIKKAGIQEGDIIAVSVTKTDGSVIDTNIKVQPSDIELFNTLKNMR